MIKCPAACAAGSFIPCRGGHCPPAKAGTHSPDGGRTMCAPTCPRKQDASMSARKGRDAFTGRRAHNVRPYLSPGNTTPPCPPAKAGTHSPDGGRTMCAPTRPPETRCLHIRRGRTNSPPPRFAGREAFSFPLQEIGRLHIRRDKTNSPLPALRGGGLLISPPGNRTPPYPPWPGRRPAGTGTTPAPPSGCPPGRRSPCASGWPWPRPG